MRYLKLYAVVVTILVGSLGFELSVELKHEAALKRQLAAALRAPVAAAPPASASPSLAARREADYRRVEEAADDIVYSMHRALGESPAEANAAVLDNRLHPLGEHKH